MLIPIHAHVSCNKLTSLAGLNLVLLSTVQRIFAARPAITAIACSCTNPAKITTASLAKISP